MAPNWATRCLSWVKLRRTQCEYISHLAEARAIALEGECHGLCVAGRPGHKVDMSATLDERNVGGYSVAYRRDDTHFPVYITAALAAVFFTAAWITGAAYWLALAVTAAGFTYYNIP